MVGDWELVVEYDGELNGMKFVDDVYLFIIDYCNGLMLFDIKCGEVMLYLECCNLECFKGVNDLMFDLFGNLYFIDQGQIGL